MVKNFRIKDFLSLMGVLFVLLILLKVSGSLMSVIVLFLMIFFYFSKDNLFYLALFIIMLNEPLNIPFRHFEIEVLGAPIKLQYIFYIIAFIKWLSYRKNNNSVFKNYFQHKELLVLFVYTLFVSLFNAFIYGMRPAAILVVIQAVASVMFFLTMPMFFKTKNDTYRFFFMISPIVIINFMGQLVVILTKMEIFALFFGADLKYSDFANFGLVRSVYSPFISIFVFANSLYLLYEKNKNFSKKYLAILSMISFFSVILSGTRSWSLAFLIILFSWLFIGNLNLNIKTLLFGILVLYLISISSLSTQYSSAIERLSTAFDVAEEVKKGQETGESRIEKRLPFIMHGFYINPIFGLGISNLGYKYTDYHVGIATNLVRFGIVGMLLLVFFWLKYLVKIFLTSRYNKGILLYGSLLLGLILIHSLGRSVFSFANPNINMILPIILLYTFFYSKQTYLFYNKS